MRHRHWMSTCCRLPLMAIAALFILGAACQGNQESESEVPTRDINAVMEAHTAELMAIPGVTGVAIGETEDKTPCILVLVMEESDQIKQAVPKQIEGHPTRLLVTGEIKPMQGR